MKLKGKVSNKTLNAEGQGHSQVRISATVDGKKDGENVEVILSTSSTKLVDSFKVGQTVTVTL